MTCVLDMNDYISFCQKLDRFNFMIKFQENAPKTAKMDNLIKINVMTCTYFRCTLSILLFINQLPTSFMIYYRYIS